MNKKLIALALLLLMLACGGGGGGGEANDEYIYFVNAAPDAGGLTVYLNDEQAVSDLTYTEVSAAIPAVESDGTEETRSRVRVFDSVSALPEIDEDLTVAPGISYFYAILESATGISGEFEEIDLATDVGEGLSRFRIAHYAPATGAVDLYVLPAATPLSKGVAVATNVTFPAVSNYFEVRSGSYVLYVTATGTKNVLYRSNPTSLEAQSQRTFFVLERAGGGRPLRGQVLVER